MVRFSIFRGNSDRGWAITVPDHRRRICPRKSTTTLAVHKAKARQSLQRAMEKWPKDSIAHLAGGQIVPEQINKVGKEYPSQAAPNC